MAYNSNVHTNSIGRTDCITLGRIAPDFTASSTEGPLTLSQYRGRWVVLFYEPGDFSPTATSELIAFTQLHHEFEKRNVQLIGVTIDSNLADIEWLVDILQHTGVRVTFPLISDRNAEIARLYDIVNPDRIYEVSVRDAFIISPTQHIRAIISYPISCGLNTYEMLRVIDSLQTTDQFKVYTPSNWMPGDPVIVPAPQTFEEAIQTLINQEESGIGCSMWYYCYQYLK